MTEKNTPINFTSLDHFFSQHQFNQIAPDIIQALKDKLNRPHGDLERWQTALDELPTIEHPSLTINENTVKLFGETTDSDNLVKEKLLALKPWRKGPFQFLNIPITTEWNSFLKWQRLVDLGVNFENKKVLDIGCGNGVFLWPIQNAGARCVVGVDPMWLFYYQFMTFQRYAKNPHIAFLPLGIESIPLVPAFDSILSMGVLYHRKSPLDHLLQIKQRLRPKGELILETIVLPDKTNTLLTPQARYAGMRNVWMIPSVPVLRDWLIKTGYTIINQSELTKTTLDEQKQTEWMDFHSLNQFLDEKDDTKTIEGHPAPYRVIIHASVN